MCRSKIEIPELSKNVYTRLRGAYVLPDPGDPGALGLDGCLVAQGKGTLYAQSLESLAGKRVEAADESWDPVFGFGKDEARQYFIINGERKECRFCSLCKDRLNGLTGNCFDYRSRPSGCAFKPIGDLGGFRIRLGDRTEVRPTSVSTSSPFQKPYSPSGISFDEKLIRKNHRLHRVRFHLWELARKKREKDCARCIFKGLCRINSYKVVERCLVTNEKMEARCLDEIQRKFGSVETFFALLAYSGSEIRNRADSEKRRTRWHVSYPVSRSRFLIRKLTRPFLSATVTRRRIERKCVASAVPPGTSGRVAALAWFFMKEHMIQKKCVWARGGVIRRPFWVRPKEDGIEVSHFACGYFLRLDTETFRSFNEILRYAR